MAVEDHLQGLFWEGMFSARERLLIGPDYDAFRAELRDRVLAKFQPSPLELGVKRAREAARHRVALAKRPARAAAERVLGRLAGR
jgi:hypothetical protein